MQKTIVILATLDTKGQDADYLRKEIEKHGHRTIMVDVGVFGNESVHADISGDKVAEEAGENLCTLIANAQNGAERSDATNIMMKGAQKVAIRLLNEGFMDGIIAMGGSSGTTLGMAVLKELPLGLPKFMLTTTAFFASQMGDRDITVMQTPADIMGLNAVMKRTLSIAAGAISGMVGAESVEVASGRPLAAITAMGVTTSAAMKIRTLLDAKGYDSIVFHSRTANLSELIAQGMIDGVIDLTLSEILTPLSYIPPEPMREDRLEIAGDRCIPQVIAPGGIDMLVFRGTAEDVPEKYQGRTMQVHGPKIILVRTNEDEVTDVGKIIAERINRAKGSVAVAVPLKGFSDIDQESHAFYEPGTDSKFESTVRAHISEQVKVEAVDANLNDDIFAETIVEMFDQIMKKGAI